MIRQLNSTLNEALTPAIAEQHKDLWQWYLLQQEALILHEYALAQQLWTVFATGLQQHIEFENRQLFATTMIEQHTWRWPASLYIQEHEKILSLMQKISDRYDAFMALTGRRQRIAILELLEQQMQFRQVLEHHEAREEQDALQHLQLSKEAKEVQEHADNIWQDWLLSSAWQHQHQDLLNQVKQQFA